MKKGVKAVGLLSGGLDSTLAIKLLLDQGIEVHAINFTSPFCRCTPKSAGCDAAVQAARKLGNIPLRQVPLGEEYLAMILNPKHGYGRGMNPCLDCRILKLRKAAQYMEKIGAAFLFTGEVVGQRPMSQRRRALELIDRESGMAGRILRPLSAQILPETQPERDGLVDRSRLLAVAGRSRKTQIGLARQFNINDYPCPAGGCLLTDPIFSERLQEFIKHRKDINADDVARLKVGRHFRTGEGHKIIVARNEGECGMLQRLFQGREHLLVPENFAGPTVWFEAEALKLALQKMEEYTGGDKTPQARVFHYWQDSKQSIFLHSETKAES
ncbi:hypothetical protein HY768_10260 [candidate division TA06 bacterium]|uniref:Thil AANH domain-containing protein n=1 Tax=candidate division TA06 bacterium TaxID=2250710 RepID=A0A933MKD0_UNCT6|nr:hypothetical protein [candidate division TA06 bacterium]